jgi:hypothetical protein
MKTTRVRIAREAQSAQQAAIIGFAVGLFFLPAFVFAFIKRSEAIRLYKEIDEPPPAHLKLAMFVPAGVLVFYLGMCCCGGGVLFLLPDSDSANYSSGSSGSGHTSQRQKDNNICCTRYGGVPTDSPGCLLYTDDDERRYHGCLASKGY